MNVRVPLLARWFRWALVIGLAAIIFYLSIITVPPETVIDRRPDLIPLDKWRHFLAYAAFGYALAYATVDRQLDPRLVFAFVIGCTIMYGIGIEVGQSLTPNRYFSVTDAYANALGGVLVLPFYVIRPHLEFVPLKPYIRSFTG